MISPGGRFEKTDEGLRILSLSQQDESNYTCEASNSGGTKSSRGRLVVTSKLDVIQSKIEEECYFLFICFRILHPPSQKNKNKTKSINKNTLLISVPPTIASLTKTEQIIRGQNFYVQCDARGIPEPVVSWKFNVGI